MPESVEIPAPVSTASRRPASASRAAPSAAPCSTTRARLISTLPPYDGAPALEHPRPAGRWNLTAPSLVTTGGPRMPTVITEVDPELATVAVPTSPAARDFDASATPVEELDRQVRAYVESGVADLLGLDEAGLAALVAPLRAVVERDGSTFGHAPAQDDDDVDFLLVLRVPDVNDAVPAMRRGSKLGVSVIDREELATYVPVEGVEVPDAAAYLLTGIDVGSEFLNIRPEDALVAVRERGRTPLTIAEGVALAIVRPDRLRPNRCFSLMGSRTGTNQRVPAVWISERRAKLGWCWDRNPH